MALKNEFRPHSISVARAILDIMRGGEGTKFKTSESVTFLKRLIANIWDSDVGPATLNKASVTVPNFTALRANESGNCCGTRVWHGFPGIQNTDQARIALLGIELAMREQLNAEKLAIINHHVTNPLRQVLEECGWQFIEYNNAGGNNLFHAYKVIGSGD